MRLRVSAAEAAVDHGAAHADRHGTRRHESCRRHLGCHGTRYAVRGTRYVRPARGWYAYGVRTVEHQLSCAAGTHSTQEAGTRGKYVQYGGTGTYVSTQAATAPPRLKAASDWRKRSGRIAPVKTTALPHAWQYKRSRPCHTPGSEKNHGLATCLAASERVHSGEPVVAVPQPLIASWAARARHGRAPPVRRAAITGGPA